MNLPVPPDLSIFPNGMAKVMSLLKRLRIFRRSNSQFRNKGFTLIEITLVVAIIVILMALVVPVFFNIKEIIYINGKVLCSVHSKAGNDESDEGNEFVPFL